MSNIPILSQKVAHEIAEKIKNQKDCQNDSPKKLNLSIASDAFEYLPLEELYLYENKTKEINAEIFIHLKNLRELNLNFVLFSRNI